MKIEYGVKTVLRLFSVLFDEEVVSMDGMISRYQKMSLPVKIFYLLIVAAWIGVSYLVVVWYLDQLSPVKLLLALALFELVRWWLRRRDDGPAFLYLLPFVALIGASFGVDQDMSRYGTLGTLAIIFVDIAILLAAIMLYLRRNSPIGSPADSAPVHWTAGTQPDGSAPQVRTLFDRIFNK